MSFVDETGKDHGDPANHFTYRTSSEPNALFETHAMAAGDVWWRGVQHGGRWRREYRMVCRDHMRIASLYALWSHAAYDDSVITTPWRLLTAEDAVETALIALAKRPEWNFEAYL